MVLSSISSFQETPARILSTALQEARAELREMQTRLRDAERELALLDARYRMLAAERLGPMVTLASGAVLNLDQRTATRDGRTVSFPKQEWVLVELLLAARRPIAKATLVQTIWDGACVDHAVVQLVHRVRERLGSVGAADDIRNLSGHRVQAWYELMVTP